MLHDVEVHNSSRILLNKQNTQEQEQIRKVHDVEIGLATRKLRRKIKAKLCQAVIN
jgi:hypothetical protein